VIELSRHLIPGSSYKSEKIAPAIIIYAGKECYQVDVFTTAVPWNALQDPHVFFLNLAYRNKNMYAYGDLHRR